MSHTPGKWKIRIWEYPDRKDLVIENEHNRIAVCDWDQGLDNPYTIQESEARANAELIAAAPALLEALESCVDKLPLRPEGANPEFLPCMKAARAIIKQVKGS